MVANVVEKIMDFVGIPKSEMRTRVAVAYAKCVVTCASNPTPKRIKQAVTDCFEECGLVGWKAETMTNALTQVVKGAKNQPNIIEYVMCSLEKLVNLFKSLSDFEDYEDEDCEDDDECQVVQVTIVR